MKKQRQLIELIKKRLATELGISVDVRLVEQKTLERSDGKAERVIDRRQL
jgi:phenylacetate-CoA ligase